MVAATSTTQRFSTPGEQGVLLGLAEAVDLVEEEHGVAAGTAQRASRASSSTRRTSLTPALTAFSSTNRRSPARDSTCAIVVFRCRAGPRGPRDGAGRPARAFRQAAQRGPGREQVVLADDLVDRARPHADGERRAVPSVPTGDGVLVVALGGGEQIGHDVHGTRGPTGEGLQRP